MQNNKPIAPHKIAQFIANLNVINELAKPEPNIDVLKQYNGFGGLKRCFWDKNLYGQLMRAIRANFGTDQEKEVLESLRNSSNSAYYTPKEVISFIYRYLNQVCKFTGGDILEPSCGNGAFFEYMPEEMRNNSKITGIEYDTLTAKLVQRIYPDVEIINNGLQYVDFNDKKFDLIIGNPPYSAEKITDNFMPDLNNYTIHHYFVAKCMRLLNDNGLLALVMPSFYMDIPRKNTRHIIDNESVVIDVLRLPDNLFSQATVTVDIIFIRKTGNKIHNIVNTTELVQGESRDTINQYWIDNPKRILGTHKLKWVEAYKRYVPCCQTQNREQALKFLELCEFTQQTIENYQKVVATNSNNQIITTEQSTTTELIKSVLEILQSEVFEPIEIMSAQVIQQSKKLHEIHEKAFSAIKKLTDYIDNQVVTN